MDKYFIISVNNMIKLNKEFKRSIVWTIENHSHIPLIDNKGNFLFPKNFDPMKSNLNKNKLIIKDKINESIYRNSPIEFYATTQKHYVSNVVMYDMPFKNIYD